MKLLSLLALIIALPIAALAAEEPTLFSGRCAQVDPGFPYYQNRSNESIVEEVAAHGYDSVALYMGSGALAKAFAAKGIPARYTASANVLYRGGDKLPKGWKKWMMVLRKGNSSFTYFCENNPDFRKWKKNEIVTALAEGGYSAVDIMEPFLPAYGGPKDTHYGCFCSNCKAVFFRMYPEEKFIPDFNDPKSPHYWKTDTALYKKWVNFRVATVCDFLDDMINGPGGVREKYPDLKICTWSIAADVPNPVETMREWEATDAVAICKKIHPDAHCIQTDWPDWTRPGLSPNYALKYKPFVDVIRAAGLNIPIGIQWDCGSNPDMRRSGEWTKAFERASKEAGFAQTVMYEYHIGLDMYTKPPKLVKAHLGDANKLTLVFDQRLDPAVATNAALYKLASGKVLSASLDGNIVAFSVENVKQGDTITVLRASNDPSVRCYNGKLLANVSSEMSMRID